MTKPKHLNLRVLSECFAVCRFPPNAAVPPWATPASASFVSITRTAEELSIVCPQKWVRAETPDIQRDWTCYKIQGPLDFSWTGILASLANPLADAGISIFAISTYDTDYILVKQDKAENATAVFQQEGHSVTYEPNITEIEGMTTTCAKPVDGPATEFVADPFVASLVESNKPAPENFGLVVVTGWPPKREHWLRNYAEFCAAVQLCFDEPDVSAPVGSISAVYLYPFSALHTTVATFRPFTLSNADDLTEPQKDGMIGNWTRVFEMASRSELWPKAPLRLEIESAQLGAKAGILLWKETTGGLEAIRSCIESAFQDFSNDLPKEAMSMAKTFAIPKIVHSTFCRFYKVPLTNCDVVQERFQREVVPNLSSIFPSSIEVSSVSLVCERTPYMHITNDEKHVLLQWKLH